MNEHEHSTDVSHNSNICYPTPIDLAECTFKRLSAASVLHYIEDVRALCRLLCYDEQDKELALAISEHAALAFHCLYMNDNAVFNTPLDAAQRLTINQLCDIYDEYLDQNQDMDEQGQNEGFENAIKSIEKGAATS